jgi:signal transduction histidine kinase
MADSLPSWMGSVRFRLTAIYSLVLFGLAAVLVAGIYLAVAARLHKQVVADRAIRAQVTPNGLVVPDQQQVYEYIEHQANERALRTLRQFSFTALSLLFLASLAVGWVVAGRVLAPIERITAVARDIQVTDLQRRIGMRGPPDELQRLADTFDAMLGRLDEAFEGQRRFIHEASHELRNPLAVIRTNLDVLQSDPDADIADYRTAAEVVQRSTERMGRLVDDLLVYADRGSPTSKHEPVDVAMVVHDVAAEFLVPADARGSRLLASADPGLWVYGDRDTLRRALANLLANAVRLSEPGSTIRLAAGRETGWIWMAVEDEGPGIPPEQRELVFRRFWRGDEAGARREGRSGLGLTIVRQIAEAHRGTVRLLPSPKGGSTFVIWLPASASNGAPGAPSSAAPPAPPDAPPPPGSQTPPSVDPGAVEGGE